LKTLAIKIHEPAGDKTLRFAADELARYITAMDPSVKIAERGEGECDGAIHLGVDDLWGDELPDPSKDDAIHINVDGCCGAITGSNPRSVLVGVYRFLKELGCVFDRPGPGGERAPKKPFGEFSVFVREKAKNRHRAVCVEGACSFEHVTALVDWLPKAGYNGYFMQFFKPYEFFRRWYSHENNPSVAPEPFTPEEAAKISIGVRAEVKKRGLMYHAVGHGWTCEPFGIPGVSWASGDYKIPEAQRGYFALVNGSREINGGVPLNTELCYSNTSARKILAETVRGYCESNPEVDYVHVWLSDGANSHCECEGCSKHIPSDWYVILLNEIDALLTERGLTAKVVFLIYCDLLFAPQSQKFNNPGRFTMMFAPIGRDYSKPFPTEYEFNGELAPYKRNANEPPKSLEEALERLRLWREVFDGDSFLFDYHLLWMANFDLGGQLKSEVLFEDLKNIRGQGFNGSVMCQMQRCFFPDASAMNLGARALWGGAKSYEAEAVGYYQSVYNSDGLYLFEYLKKLTGLFDLPALRSEKDISGYVTNMRAILRATTGFFPIVNRNALRMPEWEPFLFHRELCNRFAKVFALKARGDAGGAKTEWERLVAFINENELKHQYIFDAHTFADVIGKAVERTGPGFLY